MRAESRSRRAVVGYSSPGFLKYLKKVLDTRGHAAYIPTPTMTSTAHGRSEAATRAVVSLAFRLQVLALVLLIPCGGPVI
jgi:hypothetical protein